MHNKLRVHRVDRPKPLSQMDVADGVRELGLDMSRDRVWRIEKGRYEPTAEEQEAIAQVLGVSRDLVFPPLPEDASVPSEATR